MLVSQDDPLRALNEGRADVPRGVDAGDVRRTADVVHDAAKARLGSAERESIAEAADPERVPPTVEMERARTCRPANDLVAQERRCFARW